MEGYYEIVFRDPVDPVPFEDDADVEITWNLDGGGRAGGVLITDPEGKQAVTEFLNSALNHPDWEWE